MKQFNIPEETLKTLNEALSRVPIEDLADLYGETVEQFISLREKLQSTDKIEQEAATKAADELKESLKTKMAQLYKNVGVDFGDLLKLIKKNNIQNDGNIII